MRSKKQALLLLLLTAFFICVPVVFTLLYSNAPEDTPLKENQLEIQEAAIAMPGLTPKVADNPATAGQTAYAPSPAAVADKASPVTDTAEPAADAAELAADTVETAADTAVIIFTFDDGCLSDYELAYPILKAYGIRGTSYIIPKYPDSGKPNTLTWDMIREMAAYGWVFGCHTYAHNDLKKMTADEIKQSMEKVNSSFLAQGLEPPAIHAFPYGRFDEKAVEAIKPYRSQMRKAFYECKFVDPKTADPYGIDSCSADMRTEKRLLLHEKLVDKAVQEKAILVFRCHGLYREAVDDMGKWTVQTDSRLFKKLVEYCVKKGCRFMTMTELAQICSYNNKP